MSFLTISWYSISMNESPIEGRDPDPTLQVGADSLPAGLWHSFNPGAWQLANSQPCLLVRWLFWSCETSWDLPRAQSLLQADLLFSLLFISPSHKNKCDKARKERGGTQAGGWFVSSLVNHWGLRLTAHLYKLPCGWLLPIVLALRVWGIAKVVAWKDLYLFTHM